MADSKIFSCPRSFQNLSKVNGKALISRTGYLNHENWTRECNFRACQTWESEHSVVSVPAFSCFLIQPSHKCPRSLTSSGRNKAKIENVKIVSDTIFNFSSGCSKSVSQIFDQLFMRSSYYTGKPYVADITQENSMLHGVTPFLKCKASPLLTKSPDGIDLIH